jgi:hypothetical protein
MASSSPGRYAPPQSAPSEPLTSIWQYVLSDHIRIERATPSGQALPTGTSWSPQQTPRPERASSQCHIHSHTLEPFFNPVRRVPVRVGLWCGMWWQPAQTMPIEGASLASSVCPVTTLNIEARSGRGSARSAIDRYLNRHRPPHPSRITVYGHASLVPVCAILREPVTGVTGSQDPLTGSFLDLILGCGLRGHGERTQ